MCYNVSFWNILKFLLIIHCLLLNKLLEYVEDKKKKLKKIYLNPLFYYSFNQGGGAALPNYLRFHNHFFAGLFCIQGIFWSGYFVVGCKIHKYIGLNKFRQQPRIRLKLAILLKYSFYLSILFSPMYSFQLLVIFIFAHQYPRRSLPSK